MCHKKITARIYLAFHVLQILIKGPRFRMSLRIGSAAHAEIPRFLDEADEVAGMGEVRFRQLVHPLRTITAQGEDIINAAGFHVAKDAGDAIFFRTDTS